ncbi:winged helix-turn-helix domain-containing protein [Streptomyces sp. NPDC093089]|uniref:winged helix-turn-helix domain-containing protein n=1 Tax=Streptomyces sp. NPDC093089 TaxID=3366024 RepID=UPI003809D44C
MKAVTGRRFHLTYTIQGVRKLLVRNGWSCRVPARRAIERDDEAVAGWVKEVWPRAEDSRRPVEPGSSRGRSRILHDAAAGEDLVTAWPEHLVQQIRRGLRHIQYHSDLADGCLTETALTIRPT